MSEVPLASGIIPNFGKFKIFAIFEEKFDDFEPILMFSMRFFAKIELRKPFGDFEAGL
jgi:hypothetical protein